MVSSKITIIDYNEQEINVYHPTEVKECFAFRNNNHITWINVEGLDKTTVHELCVHFNIHFLFEEDILSNDQRPKYDAMDNIIFCLLYMLRNNPSEQELEREQISIILGDGFVISFQTEPEKDAFARVRQALNQTQGRIRQKKADFLAYSLLDAIVDDYQVLIDQFGDKIEEQEDVLILQQEVRYSMPEITRMRKNLTVMRRTILPVREIINNLLRNENGRIEKNTIRYFKDVYDHILQSQDILESYHEGMANLHDLYLNKANLKMNESMNIMAIVTCLLAPATVVAGLFGMNFTYMPFLHNKYSFSVIVLVLAVLFFLMIFWFRKKRWI